MKVNFKHSLNLCLVVSALILTSCGKKENKVNSNGAASASPFNTSSSSFSTNDGSVIVNQVNTLKTSMPCMNGYRLNKDVSFYTQGGIVGANRIRGNWVPGFSPNGGAVNKMWVGVSAFRDLMFVTQVMNGSTVMGFNVTLSFCEMKNASSGFPSVISNERELTNFSTPGDIIVEATARCGHNLVSLAKTLIVSQRDLSNAYTVQATAIPTTFAPPGCK